MLPIPIDSTELLMEDPDAPEEENFDALYRTFQFMWANTLFDVDRRAYMIRDLDMRVRKILQKME